jgi:hypothetical protein
MCVGLDRLLKSWPPITLPDPLSIEDEHIAMTAVVVQPTFNDEDLLREEVMDRMQCIHRILKKEQFVGTAIYAEIIQRLQKEFSVALVRNVLSFMHQDSDLQALPQVYRLFCQYETEITGLL